MEKTHFCRPCSLSFDNASRLRTHVADFHRKKTSVCLGNGKPSFDIHRDSEGWKCPCGHIENGEGSSQRIRRHVKICQSDENGALDKDEEEDGDVKIDESKVFQIYRKPPGVGSALISSPPLNDVLITVNRKVKVAVCGWCGSGIKRHGVISHLLRRHDLRGIEQSVEKEAERILVQVGDSVEGAIMSMTPRPEGANKRMLEPIEGLCLREGLFCLLCPVGCYEAGTFSCFHSKVMKHHVRNEHFSSLPMNEVELGKHFDQCCLQSIFLGNERHFFPVWIPPEYEAHSGSSHDSVVDAAKDALRAVSNVFADEASCSTVQETCDRRCVGVFLSLVGWQDMTSGMDCLAIESYANEPVLSVWEDKVVLEACETFLKDAKTIASSSVFLTLRYLGPGSDGVTPGRFPFKPVQEEKTVHRYAIGLTRLVLMLLRRIENGKYAIFPSLSTELEIAVKDLHASLFPQVIQNDPGVASSSPLAVEVALIRVLQLVFCTALNDSCHRNDHIVSQYVMFSNFTVKEGWKGPMEAGHTVAMLQYACRCTLLTLIKKNEPSEEERKDLYKMVSTCHNTPFCALSDVMKIAAHSSSTTFSLLPSVTWSVNHEPYTTLSIGPELVSLSGLETGMRELMTNAERILEKNLLLGLQLSGDEWCAATVTMEDNVREARTGYSLVHENINPRLHKLKDKLMIHICDSDRLRERFFKVEAPGSNGRSKVLWRRCAVRSWSEEVCNFVEHLIALIHVLGGGPARAEELATVSVTNSPSSSRNIYWVFNTMMVLTRYHKSQNMISRSRPVPRFLPRRLAMLVLKYIALVKPFELLVLGASYFDEVEDEKAVSLAMIVHRTYLFAQRGRRMTGTQICNAFSRVMCQVLGFPLKFSQYRHISIAFTKVHIKHRALHESMGPNYRIALDEQAGHSASTGELLYGISNQDHQSITSGELLNFWRASNEWHYLLNIVDSPSRGWDILPNEKASISEANGNVRGPRMTEQGGESVRRQERQLKHHMRRMEGLFETYGHPESPADILGERPWKFKRRGIDASCMESSESAELELRLRMFTGIDTRDFLSPEQMLAAREILRGRDDLLIVLPTGGGKTLAYTLPVWIEGRRYRGRSRVTVVIVPLVSLTKDLLRRISARGLSVGEWKDRESLPSILLVPVEVTESGDFYSYTGSLAASGLLARIVVEEAHIRLTWESFRPSVRALGLMRPVSAVPLILVTGTLPVSLEPELAIKYGSFFNTIRKPTVRKNLSYRIYHVDGESETGRLRAWNLVRHDVYVAVIQLLKSRRQDSVLDRDSRIIIYCLTRLECDEMLKVLEQGFDCAVYHRGMEEKYRLESEKKWREGRARVMIATSAFGTGIDFPGVRLVVHVGHSPSLLDYAQETGRAGRDGKRAECVTIAHSSYSIHMVGGVRVVHQLAHVPPTHPRTTHSHATQASTHSCLLEFVRGQEAEDRFVKLQQFLRYSAPSGPGLRTRCRRQQLQEYLDGRGENCISIGGGCALCDVCEAEKSRLGNLSHASGNVFGQNPDGGGDDVGEPNSPASNLPFGGVSQNQEGPVPGPHASLEHLTQSSPSVPSGSGAHNHRAGAENEVEDIVPGFVWPLSAAPSERAYSFLIKGHSQTPSQKQEISEEIESFSRSEDLIESPGIEVKAATRGIQIRRSSLNEAMSRAIHAAHALDGFCVVCAVCSGEFNRHAKPSCGLMRRRCLRCLQSGHSVRDCTVEARGFTQSQDRVCFKCGFDHDGVWGSKCTSGLDRGRDVSLILRATGSQWFKKSFPEAFSNESTESFLKWLYKKDEKYVPSKLIQVLLGWWEHFHGRSDA